MRFFYMILSFSEGNLLKQWAYSRRDIVLYGAASSYRSLSMSFSLLVLSLVKLSDALCAALLLMFGLLISKLLVVGKAYYYCDDNFNLLL